MKKKKILCLLLSTVMLFAGCGNLENKKAKETSLQVFAMDTYMTIKTYSDEEDNAAKAVAAEIYRLDAMLSTGSDTSVISDINKNGGGEVTEEISYLVEKSIELNKETDGAFDITIYPVMRAWGFTDENFRVPKKAELDALLKNVDASLIVLEDNQIFLSENQEIDLGGIAKGYTGQRAVEILEEYNIKSALLYLGGNIVCVGNKPNGEPWKIGIEDPEKNGNYLGAISVTDKSVVTSGGYERYFEEDGITYHHIIDPDTGYPAYNGLVSVTIVCTDGTKADGLSTSLFIMGTDKAVSFWKEHSSEFDCVFYTEDGRLLVSEGLEDSFTSNYKYEIIEK